MSRVHAAFTRHFVLPVPPAENSATHRRFEDELAGRDLLYAEDQAASLCHLILSHQPFEAASEAFALLMLELSLNWEGFALMVTDEELWRWRLEMVAGRLGIDQLTRRIQERISPPEDRLQDL